jgi:hypothetical protein
MASGTRLRALVDQSNWLLSTFDLGERRGFARCDEFYLDFNANPSTE